MTDVSPDQRGTMSGMLNLSRNLGLITGASVMGTTFALASATTEISTAPPEAVATGMRNTFAVAAILMGVALAVLAASRTLQTRRPLPETVALMAAFLGLGLFMLAEKRASAPLIQLAMFRDSGLDSSLIASVLVSTVMMTTLVVGPFYLSRALGLHAALVGITMSAGPLVAALAGVPAGRLADRFGAGPMTIVGLSGIGVGCFILSMLPATLGIPGYIVPVVVITAAYALFQTANG